MDTQRVYVKDDNTAVVKCPNCGTAKTVNTGKLKNRGKASALRCSCRSVFRVFFEFRKSYRKKTNLEGYYAILPVSRQWGKMRVDTISLNGIGFTTLNKNNLKKGDRIKAKFNLDDGRHSEVEKQAVVMWANNKSAGCEFTQTDEYDTILGFYLR